ncbi:MAG: holo-[acyl-carrier-protein] synthase [Nitrospirae bacterium]|nr:holo-[acyl-carrier-protein] synthase [Nitrospirota bacterium]
MIRGIGIDIVKTSRIRAAVERWGNRFLERVFTSREVAYAYQKNDPFLSLSVRFAAKEAFIKAYPDARPISLTDIEISNTENGRPQLHLRGRAKQTMEQAGMRRIHVSLSHEKDYGIACVVIEEGH